jgi:prepilin-type N-terminal cleavage/methylation domain-containing protein
MNRSAEARRTSNGFTLIEMLVVIAMLALLSGLAFPALERTVKHQEFALAAARVENFTRQARADAVRRDEVVRVIELQRGDVAGPVRTESLTVPTRMAISYPINGIRFFPDGSSTGGTITLVDGGRQFVLVINPDTGSIGEQR